MRYGLPYLHFGQVNWVMSRFAYISLACRHLFDFNFEQKMKCLRIISHPIDMFVEMITVATARFHFESGIFI